MNNTGIREQVIEEIRILAEKYQIEKIYLFGSRARGDYHRTSDIDLAVSGGDFDRFALDIDEDTSTLLKFDIVDLNRIVHPELLDAIQKEGRVLYEKV
ncbi:nucleotidyltransferase domain-containing protein [Mediterraneibacter catenae]|jgi:predicted nucleotidyltransferase|uniref:Nucleotidyltransferase domain-containing protein n=1 Tax=Mediterraneibacter catenae TaxID=2594882 RepID=A0A5M9I3F0_9FIRM|nr:MULTISPECIES: nucleotidyltransferase domain-containing protein [Mediterraneibacter]OUO30568.1 nucleotidyltransferase [Lachnoclostridium sp. An298]KAA8502141.1 nucleotidyltransferase domain-containing protein [Mediterraneibacter catenae]MCF2567657.1 nucleotidyltransferase domain-containing protein [Mediterraneibacter glycyrrhizinilyticus]MDN0044128.1 nucleotidyltransferase domain-containing protein [Mediterraneibacter glycyrrhizinilyticus]MDN0062129.1 nucleotidyltransferase domain-containing